MEAIALIGAGQLGSRHLQALVLLEIGMTIYVVDPNFSSLEKSKQRMLQSIAENRKDGFGENVYFLTSIEELPKNIEVAIIATSSKVRRAVIESTLAHTSVKYMILEKFLFTKEEDYSVVKLLLEKKNVKAFVNCSRRMWPFYQRLKQKINGANCIGFRVSGSDLGIGCNSIHFLDFLAYLTQEYQYDIDNTLLDLEVKPSKREGYIEFTGTLQGKSRSGHYLTVTSYNGGSLPLLIEIISDKIRCIIRENEGIAWFSSAETDWKWEEESFELCYQSNLTNLAVKDLIIKGTCDLIEYAQSSKLHLYLLSALVKHLERIFEREIEECSIT